MIGALVAKYQVKQAFKHMGEKNLDKFLQGWHEQATFMYPGELSVSGTYQGLDQIRPWFDYMFQHFKEIEFRVKHICVDNLFDLSGNNLVIASWDVHLLNVQGKRVENTGTNIIRIENRKVVEVQDFFFFAERLPIGWNEVNQN